MVNQNLTPVNTLFFLCNGDAAYNTEARLTYNRELPRLIKDRISAGEYFRTDWSCWNSTFIEVGDRAYLVRSSKDDSNEPKGIIASGYVVAAPIDKQLKHLHKDYSHFSEAYIHESEAYIHEVDGNFYVYLQLDSVVDFDYPLEQRTLKKKLQFQGANFNFGRGGARFAPDNPQAVQALASEWEKHSLICQSQGKGRRLVDVFLEKGDKARAEKDYESALGYCQDALNVDPNYSKAINKLKICQSILEREKEKDSKTNSIQSSNLNSLKKLSRQDELASVRDELEKQDLWDASDTNEAQKRILVSIVRRQGQTKFRQTLLEAYGYKCAITGFDAEAALEAAHIIPYVETGDNDPTNGLLLRADLHTLFDLNLLAIDPDKMQVFLHPDLRNTEYRVLHEKQICIPNEVALRPNPQLLRQRLKQCEWTGAD